MASKATPMPASVASLATYLGELAERIAGSDVEWDADLTPGERQFVADLGVVVTHGLDPDILALFVFEDSDQGKRVAKSVGHKHECGQRLTGAAVTVERA